MANPLPVNFHFDGRNPDAQLFAEKHAASRITRYGKKASTAGFRTLVTRSIREGIPPMIAARQIRDMVGMNRPQAHAYMTYVKSLREQGISGARVDELSAKYKRRLINHRANTIARTETIDALSKGQLRSWDAATEKGYLDDDTEKEWIATDPCPICTDLDGKRVALDGRWVAINGRELDSPTAHPRCKCGMAVVPSEPAMVEADRRKKRRIRRDRRPTRAERRASGAPVGEVQDAHPDFNTDLWNIAVDQAGKMGYPVERMFLEKGLGKKFTVGGREWRTGGFFETASDTIHLHPNAMTILTSEGYVRGIVAHEITHSNFGYKVGRHWSRKGRWKPPKRGMFGDDIDAANLLIKKNRALLEKTDGVTDYSRAYWDDVAGKREILRRSIIELEDLKGWSQKTRDSIGLSDKGWKTKISRLSKANKDSLIKLDRAELLAINETLAEMSHIRVSIELGVKGQRGAVGWDDINDRWKELHKVVTGDRGFAAPGVKSVSEKILRSGAPADAKDSVTKYTMGDFGLSDNLRKGKALTVAQQRVVDALDELISKSPVLTEGGRDMILWRSIPKEFAPDFKKGSMVQDLSFVSTTKNSAYAREFIEDSFGDGSAVVLRIRVPSAVNHRGIDVNDFFGGDHPFAYQNEVILPRGSRFLVEKVDKRAGEVHLLLLAAPGG